MFIEQTNRYNKQPPASKIVKTDNNQLLMKYGQAYFPLRSIDKQKVPQRIRNLLNSYPCWLMKQSLVNNKQYKSIAKFIISADPKEIYVFEERQKLINYGDQHKILSCLDGINFPYLKVLHIMLNVESNFEHLGWIDAPILEELYISTQGAFTSLKPLQKSNFKNLLIVNFRCTGGNTKLQPRMFDLDNLHRTKMLNLRKTDPFKSKIYIPPGTIGVCRMDLSNINQFSKLQIQRLTNFHVPHLQLSGNQHHHFTPNAEYPWCPQLQFSQSKIYKSLNRKFDNKTVALSMIDYVFGNGFEEQLEIEHRMGRAQNPQNEAMEQEMDEYEEIDSDLDQPREVERMQEENKENIHQQGNYY